MPLQQILYLPHEAEASKIPRRMAEKQDLINRAQVALRYGAQMPVDIDIPREMDPDDFKPPRCGDWALRAARGVVAEMQGRVGIKEVVAESDPEQIKDFLKVVAEIIRVADHRRRHR